MAGQEGGDRTVRTFAAHETSHHQRVTSSTARTKDLFSPNTLSSWFSLSKFSLSVSLSLELDSLGCVDSLPIYKLESGADFWSCNRLSIASSWCNWSSLNRIFFPQVDILLLLLLLLLAGVESGRTFVFLHGLLRGQRVGFVVLPWCCKSGLGIHPWILLAHSTLAQCSSGRWRRRRMPMRHHCLPLPLLRHLVSPGLVVVVVVVKLLLLLLLLLLQILFIPWRRTCKV